MPHTATQRKNQNAGLVNILRMLFLPELVASLRGARPLHNDRRFHALLSIDGLRFLQARNRPERNQHRLGVTILPCLY
jgi:hypothetical protein